MATKREVELVIKARDQVTAAANGIVKALEGIISTQQGLSKTGATTNTALNRLSTELANLQKNAQSLTALNRMASQFDRASKNVDGLKAELSETSARLESTANAAQQSALRFAELQGAALAAGRALESERADLAAAREEQLRLSQAIAQAKENYQRLLDAVRSQKRASDAQKQSLRDQRDALISLIEAQGRQAAVIQQAQSSVRIAGQAFSSLTRQANEAGTATNRTAEALVKLQTAAQAQAAGLNEAEQALVEARQAANEAAGALGGVEVKQEAIASESARVAAAIKRVSDALVVQRDVAKQAAAQAAAGGAGAANSAFKQQEQAVLAAKNAAVSAAAEYNKLRGEIAGVAAPTQVMVAEFEAARATANAATAVYRQQAAALEALRASSRSAAEATKARGREEAFLAAIEREQVNALNQTAAANHRTAVAARLLGKEVQEESQAFRQLGPAAIQAATGVKQYDDKSRRALSLTQRFRGEVLSLATNFLGLYAAVSGVGGVISALRSVEAAASRLNAVFDGNQNRVREELRFISQEADRLGLSFQVLSQEYGRLAIAADAANFSNDAVRKIFLSVAEAGRVNKVSTEELEGTFLALQQIISKGTVSMEELRRQLGDRLPGAFNIFADALGVTTAELDSMIRKGEVVASQETLLKFADELTKRFGGALPASLETVTTQIDRFANNLFQAQTLVAQGGFAEALRDALEKLNKFFKSSEGQKFFLSIGAALGTLVNVFSFVIDNAETLLFVFKAFVASKIATSFLNIASAISKTGAQAAIGRAQFLALDAAQQKQIATQLAANNALGAFTTTMRLAVGQLGAAIVAMVRTGVASATTAGAFRGLGASIAAVGISVKSLLLSLGPVAAATVAIGFLIDMFTNTVAPVNDATAAITEHTRQLDQYQIEANEAERAGRAFNASLVETTALQARANLEELSAGFNKVRDAARDAAQTVTGEFAKADPAILAAESAPKLADLIQKFKDGKLSATNFQKELRLLADQLGQTDKPLFGLISRLISVTDEASALELAIGRQAIVAKQLGDDSIDLTNILRATGLVYDELTGKIGGATNALEEQARQAEVAKTAFGRIEDLIPELQLDRSQAKRREQFDKDAAESILASAGLTPEEIERRKKVIDEARVALEKTFKEERDKLNKTPKKDRDAQKEFNEELDRTNRLRDFEATLIGKSNKDKEIELAIFQARLKAEKEGVKFSADQEAALRKSLANSIDLEEAERVRNLTMEEQIKLREDLGLVNSVQDRIEIEARKQKIDLLTEEGKAWAEVQRQILERADAEKEVERATERVRALERQRQEALEEFNAARKAGELSPEQQRNALVALEEQRLAIEKAKNEAIALAQAIGDEKSVAALARLKPELSELQAETRRLRTEFADTFATGLTDALFQVGEAIGKAIDEGERWEKTFRNIRDIFLQFAADFLLNIAKMITQALLLQAIQNSPLGGIFGDVAGFLAGITTGATQASTIVATAITTAGTTAGAAVTTAGLGVTTGLELAATTAGATMTAAGASIAAAITAAGAAAASAIAAAAAAAAAASVLHGGGIAGFGGMSRKISPGVFAGAQRFHTGGVAGLRADEVPAVLKKGEEVITAGDPRHRRNGGLPGGTGEGGVRIINTFDPAEFLEKALASPVGQRTITNYMRANKTAINGALN